MVLSRGFNLQAFFEGPEHSGYIICIVSEDNCFHGSISLSSFQAVVGLCGYFVHCSLSSCFSSFFHVVMDVAVAVAIAIAIAIATAAIPNAGGSFET